MTKTPISPFFLIFVVALIGMLAPFSIDTYLPSFPAIEHDLAVSREVLIQSLSVYLIFFALATLVWGPLSDRFGRRPVILASLIGYLAASLIVALANSYEMLILGRALQGILVAGSLVASRAMIRDVFDRTEAQKAMALMMMLFSVAPAAAPIIGGWLEVHFGWRAVFYFLAIYGLLLFAVYALRIHETRHQDHIQSIAPKKLALSYWDTLLHPHFLRIVIAQGFLIGGFFIYVSSSTSLIYDHLHLGEQDFWVFFVPLVSGILFGSIASHRFAHRFSAHKIIWLAFIFSLVSVLSNLFIESIGTESIVLIIAPLVLYAFGFALANPALSVLGLDCLPEKRGMASSVQSLFQMGMAGMVTALIVPYVHDSLLSMAIAQSLLFATTLFLWFSVSRSVRVEAAT